MITIIPVQPSHLSHFPAIINASWTHDTNTLLKNTMRGTTWLSSSFTSEFQNLLSNPRVQIVVAVDDENDNLPVGWCIWGFRGFVGEELEGLKVWTEEDRAVKLQSPTEEERERARNKKPMDVPPMPEMSEEEMKAGTEKIDAMEKVQSENMQQMMAMLMPEGCKCLYVYSITVSDAVQGKGVGSALARWGMRRCDSVGTYAWMHASEAARFLFQSVGWELYDQLEMDLDEWDPRPEGKREGSWGKYTFRYFRWPTVKEREQKKVEG